MTDRIGFLQQRAFQLCCRLAFALVIIALVLAAGFSSKPGLVPSAQASDSMTKNEPAAFSVMQGQAALAELKAQGLDRALKLALLKVRRRTASNLATTIFTDFTLQGIFSAFDGSSDDYFGTSVAISGDTVVVGVPGDDFHFGGSSWTDAGSAYVFTRSGADFVFQQKLSANPLTSNESFGQNLAISGNTLVVGAPGADSYQGAAYVFVRTNTTWNLQQRLTAVDGAFTDFFGTAVTLDGNTLVVGAPNVSVGLNQTQGVAYVFVRSGNVWSQQQKLLSGDGAASDRFGGALVLQGDTAVISAYGKNNFQGAVYVFTRAGSSWSQQQKLSANNGQSGDLFGYPLAFDTGTLVVGASALVGTGSQTQGAAYVFTKTNGLWSQQQKLTAFDGADNNHFGLAVGISGNTAAVGSYINGSQASSAYIFTRSGSVWTTQQKLTYPNQTGPNPISLDLAGNTLVVGTPHLGNGAAFIYEIVNTAPTISPVLVQITRKAGSVGTTSVIASVSDTEDSESSLQVTVNGGASAQIGAVTVSNLIVDGSGQVSATIQAACTPVQNASFTLRVTDSAGAFAELPLTILVMSNTAPTLSYNNPPAMNAGATLNVNPASGLVDNGTTSVVVQSVTPASGGTVTVSPTGIVTISNPTIAGAHVVVVRATDNCGAVTDASFTFNVTGGCPAITVPQGLLPTSFVNQNYSVTFTASGGAAPYAFTVIAGALPDGLTLASSGALSGTLTAAGTFPFTIKATDANGCTGTRSYSITVNPVLNPVFAPMQFYPLAHPVRLLDTRVGAAGCDAPGAKIAGNTSRTQTAAGRTCDGLTIPANAMALVGTATTVESGGGHFTLYPSDIAKPNSANSNFAANQILNSLFTVRLGASDGAFKIFVSSDTDIVVDITGYYAPPSASGLYFHPLPKPVRLLDTRPGASACFMPGAMLQGDSTTSQIGTTTCDGVLIPAGAQALTGNATTVSPQANGFLTLYPADAARPLIASANFQPGINLNSPFMVGLSPSGQFNIYVASTTDLVVDVTGYYSTQLNDANGQGLLFNVLNGPVRLLDTRPGQTGCFTPGAQMIGGTSYTQVSTGACTNIPATAQAVVGNATTLNAAANGYLTFWPSNANQPFIATSNYRTGITFNRHFTVGLGNDGAFKRYAASTTDLVIDLCGYFAP